MIYLDNGATSFHKPLSVRAAVLDAMERCANPGRGGYGPAMEAARRVYRCRERAAAMFDCQPEQVVLTANCTHGLNIALRTLVRPGMRVAISGFEHNAVTRTLELLGAEPVICGRRLFHWADTLDAFEQALRTGVGAAVFTHVSNVFGYILPAWELGELCRHYGVPFVLDAAQSAGMLPVRLKDMGAEFIAMAGHKCLLGPQGTGILLCGGEAQPLMAGGTGSESRFQTMPGGLPERLEPGTVNVPGIAGLEAGLTYLQKRGIGDVMTRAHREAANCGLGLEKLGLKVFRGDHQAATVSFLPPGDCEEFAEALGKKGIAVRAGLHCAPLAHESAGTLETGTVRLSFGHDAHPGQTAALLGVVNQLLFQGK